MPNLDLIAVGRVNLDLYAQQTGVEFSQVRGWDASVGGSPTNVAIAASRLGLHAAILTAVGTDPVGDWVLEYLRREQVDTRFVFRKAGPHTSLALRAQLPPDHPLAFFRHDPADIHLTAADADAVPVHQARALLISADALARGTTRELCAPLVLRAKAAHATTLLDLDLREVNWPDKHAYAQTVGSMVNHFDVVLGTEEEFATLLGLDHDDPATTAQQVREQLTNGTDHVHIVKQGGRGVTVHVDETTTRFRAMPVREACSIGAGDSFAAGLIHARLSGLGWDTSVEFASACAAITVSRFGCSSGFPLRDEVGSFLANQLLASGSSQ